ISTYRSRSPRQNGRMAPVVVQFYKNPDILHWGFSGFHIGEDDFGHWVGLPEGSRRWKGATPHRPTPEDAVQCFPHDGWWVLHYNGPVREVSAFVDIATQPKLGAGRIEMIDLDLDFLVSSDGKVELVDEDEFEVNQVEFGYSQELIERASVEAKSLGGRLRRGEEPFFQVAANWLELVSSGSLPGV
ncbi:MAG: DUF402 domain-containing protein, partial [Acidimicrobiia bacterium]